jgi:hypothetical protein
VHTTTTRWKFGKQRFYIINRLNPEFSALFGGRKNKSKRCSFSKKKSKRIDKFYREFENEKECEIDYRKCKIDSHFALK